MDTEGTENQPSANAAAPRRVSLPLEGFTAQPAPPVSGSAAAALTSANGLSSAVGRAGIADWESGQFVPGGGGAADEAAGAAAEQEAATGAAANPDLQASVRQRVKLSNEATLFC